MILKELIGHSGCKLYLMTKNNELFVRKISKDEKYNRSLEEQCCKQRDYKGKFALSPKVLNEGIIDGRYYFDMQYIRGNVLASSLIQCSTDSLSEIADLLINIIMDHKESKFQI